MSFRALVTSRKSREAIRNPILASRKCWMSEHKSKRSPKISKNDLENQTLGCSRGFLVARFGCSSSATEWRTSSTSRGPAQVGQNSLEPGNGMSAGARECAWALHLRSGLEMRFRFLRFASRPPTDATRPAGRGGSNQIRQ